MRLLPPPPAGGQRAAQPATPRLPRHVTGRRMRARHEGAAEIAFNEMAPATKEATRITSTWKTRRGTGETDERPSKSLSSTSGPSRAQFGTNGPPNASMPASARKQPRACIPGSSTGSLRSQTSGRGMFRMSRAHRSRGSTNSDACTAGEAGCDGLRQLERSNPNVLVPVCPKPARFLSALILCFLRVCIVFGTLLYNNLDFGAWMRVSFFVFVFGSLR